MIVGGGNAKTEENEELYSEVHTDKLQLVEK